MVNKTRRLPCSQNRAMLGEQIGHSAGGDELNGSRPRTNGLTVISRLTNWEKRGDHSQTRSTLPRPGIGSAWRRVVEILVLFMKFSLVLTLSNNLSIQVYTEQEPARSPKSDYRSLAGSQFASSRHIYQDKRPGGSVDQWPNWKLVRNVDDGHQAEHGSAGGSSSSSSSRLVSLKNQLHAMRDQLESELRLVGARRQQVALGSACTQSGDCRKGIENSHCKIENFTCTCLPQHVEYNSTTCLPSTLLGFNCRIDAQCQHRVANSFCDQQSHKCACQPNFVPYRKDKCLGPSKVNDFCLTDAQCRLGDKHSHCKWKIPNVYGTCKCPPNYKLLPADSADSLKCVPRLGDTCLTDDECLLATANSSCQESSSLVSGGRWPSSSAGTRKCHCSQGFVQAQNELECIKLWPEPGRQSSFNSLEAEDAKHHYEMLPASTTATSAPLPSGADEQTPTTTKQPEVIDIKLIEDAKQWRATSSSTTTTTTEAPPIEQKQTSGNSSFAAAPHGLSSLGKACSSRQECQARDPHSDCIEGFCECLRPTARCSAKSTGCPRDTFQCRNGQCISWYFVCDLFKNCDDGSDEDECRPGSCPREAFQCRSDGLCITRGKICNGKRDCRDGSDERHCGSELPDLSAHSNYTFEASASNPQPLPSSQNNGPRAQTSAVKNDTTTNGMLAPRCQPEAFACQDGTCLPAYVFCNAVVDCPDGSDEDERVCERPAWRTRRPQPASVSATSRPGQVVPPDTVAVPAAPRPAAQPSESPLVKTDRAAIERLLGTLALSPARTPEWRGRQRQAQRQEQSVNKRKAKMQQLPAAPVVDYASECPRWSFTCRNGKCRSSAILCSGVDGCGDNSDEENCEVCQCEPPADGKLERRTGSGSLTATMTTRQQRKQTKPTD